MICKKCLIKEKRLAEYVALAKTLGERLANEVSGNSAYVEAIATLMCERRKHLAIMAEIDQFLDTVKGLEK